MKKSVEILAKHLATVSFADLAPATVASARHCLLDALGCAGAGHGQSSSHVARRWAALAFPGNEAGVWFSPQRMALRGAAFANAWSASVLDLDDGHRAASGHPGAAVVPAVLTAALATGAGMQDILLAIACGYEAGLRMARSRNPGLLTSVASGRWTALAVAAAVGKLQGLRWELLAQALALAESQAPNMVAADDAGFGGSDIKEGIPWSVLAGVCAVEQAVCGLRGYLGALDNPAVYLPGRVVEDFGAPWLITSTYFKPYGCCRWIHAAIDAVLSLRDDGVRAGDVEWLEVETFGRAVSLTNEPAPADAIAAQFSIPFCLAVALVEGPGGLLPVAPDLLQRTDLLALARRVTLRTTDALEAMFPERVPARVRAMVRGTVWTREVIHPLGDPAHPMREADVLRKMDGILASQPAARLALADLVPRLLAAGPAVAGHDAATLDMAACFVGAVAPAWQEAEHRVPAEATDAAFPG